MDNTIEQSQMSVLLGCNRCEDALCIHGQWNSFQDRNYTMQIRTNDVCDWPSTITAYNTRCLNCNEITPTIWNHRISSIREISQEYNTSDSNGFIFHLTFFRIPIRSNNHRHPQCSAHIPRSRWMWMRPIFMSLSADFHVAVCRLAGDRDQLIGKTRPKWKKNPHRIIVASKEFNFFTLSMSDCDGTRLDPIGT